MSQALVLELDRQADGCYALRQDAGAAAPVWPARRKLLWVATLSAAAWLVVLSPLLIWG